MTGLQALGLSGLAERVYLDLVDAGETDRRTLADRLTPVPEPADLDAAIADLTALGLVEPHPAVVIPAPPALALEELARRRAREAAVARESAARLGPLWEHGAGGQSYLEMLPSPRAARAVLDRVQADATDRVRAMTVGNLAAENHTTIVDGLFEAIERGVRYQVIYGTRVLRDPAALRMVQACADAGEDARVVPEVPINLTIVDDRWALLAARASVGEHHSVAAFVVHDSPLLAGLVGIFEVFWRMAVPLSTDEPGRLTPDNRRLLSYLSAGLTDESIARELGVSERTVARRISRLQELLGARTRFQLGVQASRHGWL